MCSPAIITDKQAFPPLPSGKGYSDFLLPLHSFYGGNPFLVEISPCSGLGPIDLNTYDQSSSLPLDSNLSPQIDRHPLVFWSKTNTSERSGRWI